MPTILKNIGCRANQEFIEYLDTHLKNNNWQGTRNDYILTAIIEKMVDDNFEVVNDIPAAKGQPGIKLTERPEGWKSRLYADRYELVVKPSDNGFSIQHLHESPDQFRSFKKAWFGDINGEFEQGYIYIHSDLREYAIDSGSSIDGWIDSTIHRSVEAWLISQIQQ